MAVSYVEEYCPRCEKLSVFQCFASYSGVIRTCMDEDCGFWEILPIKDEEDDRR